jgi:hypothetical protein
MSTSLEVVTPCSVSKPWCLVDGPGVPEELRHAVVAWRRHGEGRWRGGRGAGDRQADGRQCGAPRHAGECIEQRRPLHAVRHAEVHDTDVAEGLIAGRALRHPLRNGSVRERVREREPQAGLAELD